MSSPKARLILHIDVNKTLVMSDVAGGKSMENILNESIADLVWGKVHQVSVSDVEEREEPGVCLKRCPKDQSLWQWTLTYTDLSTQRPTSDDEFEQLRTFHDFVENVLYPYHRTTGMRNIEESEKIYAYNQSQREVRI
jgi:hypothetical protein